MGAFVVRIRRLDWGEYECTIRYRGSLVGYAESSSKVGAWKDAHGQVRLRRAYGGLESYVAGWKR